MSWRERKAEVGKGRAKAGDGDSNMECNRKGRNREDEVCIEIREERAEMKRESMNKGKKVGAMSIYLGRRVELNIR